MPAIPAPAPDEARAFLASVPLFRELGEADLDQILAHLDWMLVPGGHVVCRQGDEGDRLYLVASGRLSIVRELPSGEDVRADPSYRTAPTPGQLLLGRWRRTARPFPNILQIIHRSAVLASDIYAKQAKSEVELYLDLPMDGYDMFDVGPLDEIVELGYRFTKEQLEKNPWNPAMPGRVIAV